jgi:antitoxin HicB
MDASQAYSVVLHPAEEGGFIVRVPAFPEIVTEGDTEIEALAMAQDAVQLVLESLRDRGESIPNDSGGPLLLRRVRVSVQA